MLRGVVMLDALAMLGSHGAGVIVTGPARGAMHRAGNDGHSCAAQRRDPRREENDGEIDGKEAAHHGGQIYSDSLRAKCP